jgi:hypothetical protein
MKRYMNAKLHIDQKPVQCRVNFRIRRRVDDPDAAPRFFAEGDVGKRRRQAVIGDSELHRLAVICAAENGEAVHALGRGVKAQTRVIGKKRILRERECVTATGDDLIERYARQWRRHCSGVKPDVAERALQRDTFSSQRFGDRRKFCDWIDFFVGACFDHCGSAPTMRFGSLLDHAVAARLNGVGAGLRGGT